MAEEPATTCGLCGDPFAADQAKTALLCHHEFHTECVLREASRNEILNLRCHVCHERIVPTQMLLDAENENEGTDDIVNFFWENDTNFKADLNKFKTLKNQQKASMKLLKPKIADLQEKLRVAVEPYLAPIKAKVTETKAAFKTLPELKAAKRAISVSLNHNRRFRENWGMSFYSVKRILADKPDFKGFGGLRGFYYRNARQIRPQQFDVEIK